ALALGCSCRGKERPAPPNLPIHTLAFGGDVILGRRLNAALFDDAGRGRIFGGVAKVLKGADLALVNAEGVISEGGTFTDKGESVPIMYRAHPLAADVLREAGVDVVTVGNNHSGDYGRAAFSEMLDRLRMAGIDYAGGGRDQADARAPAYFKIGDTVVAVVGADMTHTRMYAARRNAPGNLYLELERRSARDGIVKTLTGILAEARKHAHVVLFSPHWGDNFQTAPTEAMRDLARRLIEAGYDAILGHSAHWFEGVEVIGGKPVVYDAGDLLVDYPGKDPAHEGMLYVVSFTQAGVTRLVARPVRIGANRAEPARGADRDRLLARLVDYSKKLGTTVRVEKGAGIVTCDPGGILGPEGAPVPPARSVPARVTAAPRNVVLDAVPPGATPVNVVYDNGVAIRGYEVLLGELPLPRASNLVTLYLTAERPVAGRLWIKLEARGQAKDGKPHADWDPHIPGDWMLPAARWPAGKIVADRTLMRLTLGPGGEVQFLAGLEDGKLLAPVSSDVPLVDGALVPLRTGVYLKGAPGVFRVLRALGKQ
ncbi:MAG: CapA family protein, partial [Deltaproteobacteria bacterium]|nr:CapA family protein [Deltaproteobacteria bacterium]